MENNSISDFVQVPMGTVVAFMLKDSLIPQDWLKCDGSPIPSKYQGLIKALGSSTIPNLAGRTFVGTGTSNENQQSDGSTPNFGQHISWSLGNTGGEFGHKLTTGEMPSHNHSIYGGNFGIHHRSFSGNSDDDKPFKTNGDAGKGDTILRGTDNSGGDGSHNTMQPYYVINYIIYAGRE
ncbi:phage tail protein [Flavobacterium tructae]|uniref:phage tail protein n=1 Tax=Flavobacterium tructae TaxID=1114873 RepID=UPI0035A93A49